MSSLERTGKKSVGAIAVPLVRGFMRALLAELPKRSEVTFKEIAEAVLRKTKITPEYVAAEEDPAEFARMREKLNREPGVLIANHPGAMDSFFLLNMLERKDVLVLANVKDLAALPEYQEFVAARGGQDFLLMKTTDPIQLLKQMKKIEAHIRKGGLFIIFPEGSNIEGFRDGIRVIIENILRPDDMVYACHIDKVGGALASFKAPGMASEGLIAPGANPNLLVGENRIRINERYTRSSEWRAAMGAAESKEERNIALKRHFWSLWGDETKESSRDEAA